MATARRQLGYVSSLTTQSVFVETYGTATGGASSATITVGGQNYTMLTFTATGTLTVTKAGLFDVLVVGGGGGGGYATGSSYAGGGGGGGIIEETIYLSANETVTIGAGGSGRIHINGTSSRIGGASWATTDIVGVGGGQGAGVTSGGDRFVAFGGGCGGGGYGTGNSNFTQPGDGIQGFNGGSAVAVDNNAAGGGGGGSAVGGDGSSLVGGNGGAGYDASAWRGESAATTRYAGGGGGGGTSGGTGGVGGGANRGLNSGSANTGGGGGGGVNNDGGSGGSGIVLVRFKI